MDKQQEIHTSEFGHRYFQLNVVYELDIKAIVNTFLFFSEAVMESNHRRNGQSCTPWTDWTRETTIRWLEFWLRHEGQDLNKASSYPEARRLYGEMALRFAEELFPELVYDYKTAEQRVHSFIQEIRGDLGNPF